MSTSENSTTLSETISSVLGPKFLAGLCELSVDISTIVSQAKGQKKKKDDHHHDHHDQNDQNDSLKKIQPVQCQWKIEGLISKAPDTVTNQIVARELQFFSLNGRPVDMPKISRAIGDAWRGFDTSSASSSKRRPACVLSITLPNSMCDVNLSPDKREVLISEEHLICTILYDHLVTLWSNQTKGKFVQNEVETMSNKKRSAAEMHQTSITQYQSEQSNVKPSAESPNFQRGPKMRRRNAFVNSFDNIGTASSDPTSEHNNTKKSLEMIGTPVVLQHSTEEIAETQKNDVIPTVSGSTFKIDPNLSQKILEKSRKEETRWEELKRTFNRKQYDEQLNQIRQLKKIDKENKSNSEQNNGIQNKSTFSDDIQHESSVPQLNEHSQKHTPMKQMKDSRSTQGQKYEIAKNSRKSESCVIKDRKDSLFFSQSVDEGKSKNMNKLDMDDKKNRVQENRNLPNESSSSGVVWSIFSGTDQIISMSKAAKEKAIKRKKYQENKISPKTTSSDHTQGLPANSGTSTDTNKEEEKTVSLLKDDFLTMSVIGQFNMGFILAQCKNNNLWILDQHACDEKYNFEKLIATTKFHEQKLIAPLPMELSPSEEDCILENMSLFEEHGFRFEYDDTKPPRHRLSLTALPYSGSGGDGRKAVQFGKEDVGALCSLLGADGESSSSGFVSGSGTGADGSGLSGNNAVRRYAGRNGGSIIRLPKVVAMFASRSCRSSVMIGDALSSSQMTKIIRRLHGVEQPWDCPHGRPTLRHVKNILQALLDDEELSTVSIPSLSQECLQNNGGENGRIINTVV